MAGGPDGGGVNTADLERVGRLLREAEPPIRKELTKALRGPARKIGAQQRAAARALAGKPGVPTRKAKWPAQAARDLRVDVVLTGPRQRVTTRVRRSSAGRGPWLLNRGEWRHPFYGDRQRWFEQRITGRGWFDETGRAGHADAIRETAAELDRVAERLARELGNT